MQFKSQPCPHPFPLAIKVFSFFKSPYYSNRPSHRLLVFDIFSNQATPLFDSLSPIREFTVDTCQSLFDSVKKIQDSTTNLSDDILVELLLYGNKNISLKVNCKIIEASIKFEFRKVFWPTFSFNICFCLLWSKIMFLSLFPGLDLALKGLRISFCTVTFLFNAIFSFFSYFLFCLVSNYFDNQ